MTSYDRLLAKLSRSDLGMQGLQQAPTYQSRSVHEPVAVEGLPKRPLLLNCHHVLIAIPLELPAELVSPPSPSSYPSPSPSNHKLSVLFISQDESL